MIGTTMELDLDVVSELVLWVYSDDKSLLRNAKAVDELKRVFKSNTKAGKDAHSRPIYRGLNFGKDAMAALLSGKKINLRQSRYESWTIDPNVAMRHAMKADRFGAVLSKKRPKRDSVLVDMTNEDLQELLSDYYSDSMEGGEYDYDDNDDYVDPPESEIDKFFRFTGVEQEIIASPQCKSCDLGDLECLVFHDSLYEYDKRFDKTLRERMTALLSHRQFSRKRLAILDLPPNSTSKDLDNKRLWDSLLYTAPRYTQRTAKKLRWNNKPKPRYTTDWTSLMNLDVAV